MEQEMTCLVGFGLKVGWNLVIWNFNGNFEFHYFIIILSKKKDSLWN